jgi:tripartite-type tricarboxylate transporter receptor subunit TctC
MVMVALARITPALAQAYPERTIKIIVPPNRPAGASTRRRVSSPTARPIADRGKRPGAGTLVGTEAAAKASADGHALLFAAL